MPTKTIETFGAKTLLEILRDDLAVAIGVTAKDGFAISRGDVVGVITASGKVRRRSRATVTVAFAANATTGTVNDATVFKAGDILTKSDGTAIGTILSIAGNVITLTANAANAIAIGADIIATDGSAVAKGIADLAADGSGDSTEFRIFIGGYLNESLLGGLTASAKTELGGASVAGGVFKF